LKLAEQMEYPNTCSLESGRLLQLFASQYQSGVIGEVGAGCGVGAAWIASALAPSTSFFTVEEDTNRAAAARALLDSLLNVRVIHGSWSEFLRNWQFVMLYVNVSRARIIESELLFQSLRIGGLVIVDGLTPVEQILPELWGKADLIRDFWLNDPRLLATEVKISPDEAVLLATRIE
jgi:predicted O-methyltransferase YrrM